MSFRPAPRTSVYYQQHEFGEYALTGSYLWEHQVLALEYIRDWNRFCRDRGPCGVVVPTGAGKSVIATLAPYVLGSKRTMIIAPDLTILGQLLEDTVGVVNKPKKHESTTDLSRTVIARRGFGLERKDIGALIPSRAEINHQRDINSESLAGKELLLVNIDKFDHGGRWQQVFDIEDVDLIIVDEAHHFPAQVWQDIVEAADQVQKTRGTYIQVVFLTASLYRSDNQLVVNPPGDGGLHWQEWRDRGCQNFYHFPIKAAVEARIIRPSEVLQIPVAPGPETEENRVAAAVGQAMLDVLSKKDLETPLAGGAKHHGLIIAKDGGDANRIEAIIDNPLVVAYHTVGMPPTEQSRRREQFEDKKRGGVLIVVGKLLEGYNFPPISTVAFSYGVTSPVKVYQFIGRGFRIYFEEPMDEAFCTVLVPSGFPKLRDIVNAVLSESKLPQQPGAAPMEIEDARGE